jgi:sugar phosphate isomerase/epimerase
MQLGFVTAIFPDLTLEQVLAFAADEGFACVEVMCWPRGKAERRYAGVTHLDVTNFTPEEAEHARELVRIHGVAFSGLGYYPNPLDADAAARQTSVDHLKKVIRAAPQVGVRVVNTFIGRDPNKNLAGTPAVWRALFDIFPSSTLGLNFDPSHLIWQQIDCGRAIREFGKSIVHAHAKDERIDRERLYQVGIHGFKWHVPKLPGLGDVDWGEFFAALTDVGYDGPLCIEVEDRAYEGSLDARKRALRQSRKFLEQYLG